VFLAAGLMAMILTYAHVEFALPAAPGSPDTVFFVRPGSSIYQVALGLSQRGILRRPYLFVLYARLTGADRRIQAGEYRLGPGMSPRRILNTLVQGKVITYKVTIPEGYTVRQIAELLEAKGLAGREDFLLAAQDAELCAKLGIPTGSLEGYLFPDTYYFPRGLTAKEIVRAMVAQFEQHITPQMRQRAEELGFTLHQVVTLASLIEKETGVEAERRLISAVYHNRLRRNIRLQCDPTVIYALGDKFDGNLRKEDLRLDSPYNTYRHRGLPPGPIANPGLASIQAALYPEAVDYIFFVSKNDGTHKFSTTLEEHNQAVDYFQRKRRRVVP